MFVGKKLTVALHSYFLQCYFIRKTTDVGFTTIMILPCLDLEDLFRFHVTTAPFVAADARM